MRILLVHSFYYLRGGDCAHVLALEKLLQSRGHDVAVFAMHHAENAPSPWSPFWAENVEFRGRRSLAESVHAAARSVRSGRTARRLGYLLRTFRPDVVHVHSIHHHLTLSVIEEVGRHGIPLVWTLHDYRTVCPATSCLRRGRPCERCTGGRFWEGLLGRCKGSSLSRSGAAVFESYLTRLRGSLRQVDCYVAPSLFLAQIVTRMGLPARHIEVMPNFHEPGDDSAPPGASPSRSGILFVGRVSAEKGLDCLLHACRGPGGPVLRVIGDGPLLGRAQSQARRLSVRATFDGWQDASSVHQAMQEVRLLCVPSVWYENCPIVVLEAAAMRLPVMASDVGGLRELLDDGACGWLVPSGDVGAWRETISQALADDAAREALSENARLRLLARHGADGYLTKLEDVYRSCR